MEFDNKVTDKVEKTAEQVIIEGGAVAVGLMGSSLVGRTIEGYVKPNVTPTSPVLDKFIAWGANAVPKLGLFYVLHEHGRAKDDATKNLVVHDMQKAVLGSVFIDGAIRLLNGGVNTMHAKVGGFDLLNAGRSLPDRNTRVTADLQKVIHENSVLRGQLNQAMQKLANPPQIPAYVPPVHVSPVVMTAPEPQFPTPVVTVVPQPAAPAPIVTVAPVVDGYISDEDKRRFGVMPDDGRVSEDARRRFGAMPEEKPGRQTWGFMGEESGLAAMFGMK